MSTPDFEVLIEAEQVYEVGIAGPAGPRGEAGTSGGRYEHVQAIPADTWTINHGLDLGSPAVTVVDTDVPPRHLLCSVRYPTRNTVVIELAAATAGSATVG